MTEEVSGAGPSESDVKVFLLSAVSLSVGAWDIAFNYGVYETVFFDRIFTVWAASMAVLLASLFVPSDPCRRDVVGWRGRIILLIPTVWVAIHLTTAEPLDGGPLDILLSALSVVVGLVTLPYTLYVLAIIVSPGLDRLRCPRFVAALLMVVLVIGFAGFAVGRNNELFLSCWDFTVSGNDNPPRCKE